MKQLGLIFLLGSIALNTGAQIPDERPLVLATASIFADMAQVISGDLLDVRSIVPIGGDPHTYEPTPGDARLVYQADLILCNGLTFEGWLNELIANSGGRARVVTITEGITPISSDTYENSSDPHAWMSARHGLTYLSNIRDALQTLDPDNADIYAFNYALYHQQLNDLDQQIDSMIQTIPEQQRVLITSHDAFRYYGQRYGIRVEAALGTSTDAEVQTSDVLRLTQTIRATGIPAIFVESTINPKLLQQIAADTKVKIGGKLYADSLGGPDSPAATYLEMLLHNTRTIVAALLESKQASGQVPQSAIPPSQYWLFGIIIGLMAGSFGFMVYKLNPSS